MQLSDAIFIILDYYLVKLTLAFECALVPSYLGMCSPNAVLRGTFVKSSHLYLYSAFNNTNCNKALHNIKIGKLCQ